MKIGIMGGVFDPPHIGHTISAQYILNHSLIDKILIIPCNVQPLKSRVLTEYDIRFEMTVKAFNGIDNIDVSDIEKNLEVPSYTINTIKKMKEKCNDELFFIIGRDEAGIIDKWHKFMELRKLIKFVIINKDNENYKIDKEYFTKDIFINNPVIDISSSKIRKMIYDKKDTIKYVSHDVMKIIKRENLYCEK